MAEPEQDMPMGDASMVSPDETQQPQGGLDGSMGMNPDMGMQGNDAPPMGDTSMNMGEAPNMMGGEQDMGSNPEKDRKEIQKNIGKACADYRSYQGQDKEDLGKWISGMLDSLDGESGDGDVNMEGDSIESPMDDSQEMPMESVVFTKKQLDRINETFMDNGEKKETLKNEKTKKQLKNTPFNNPDFNTKK